MYKKAALGSQTMIYLFIIIWLIIIGGIVWGLLSFFGSEYDFRQVDADILNYQIKKCLSEEDINLDINLKTDLQAFEQELYTKCNLDENITKENFYIFIDLSGEQTYIVGKGDKTQCALSEKNENYPKCKNSTLIKDQKTIFIQTGSNQRSAKKRV